MREYTFRESGLPTLQGRLLYLVDEYGFRFEVDERTEPADAELIVDDLGLGVVQSTGALTAISGFAPHTAWEPGVVTLPPVVSSRLLLDDPEQLGAARTDTLFCDQVWRMTFDDSTQLLRVAPSTIRNAVAHYEIATDVVVALDEHRSLTSVVLLVHRTLSSDLV